MLHSMFILFAIFVQKCLKKPDVKSCYLCPYIFFSTELFLRQQQDESGCNQQTQDMITT